MKKFTKPLIAAFAITAVITPTVTARAEDSSTTPVLAEAVSVAAAASHVIRVVSVETTTNLGEPTTVTIRFQNAAGTVFPANASMLVTTSNLVLNTPKAPTYVQSFRTATTTGGFLSINVIPLTTGPSSIRFAYTGTMTGIAPVTITFNNLISKGHLEAIADFDYLTIGFWELTDEFRRYRVASEERYVRDMNEVLYRNNVLENQHTYDLYTIEQLNGIVLDQRITIANQQREIERLRALIPR